MPTKHFTKSLSPFNKLESVRLSKDFDVVASAIPGSPGEYHHDVGTAEDVVRVEEVGRENSPRGEDQLKNGEDDLGLH